MTRLEYELVRDEYPFVGLLVWPLLNGEERAAVERTPRDQFIAAVMRMVLEEGRVVFWAVSRSPYDRL